MRRSVLLSALLLVQINLQGWAQSSGKYAHTEIFGGASAVTIGAGKRTELYGWQAAMTTNFKRSFGIATDFAGQYKNGISLRQSLFGPQFSRRTDRTTLFGHALFGTSRAAGTNAFTMGFGGGLDVKASDRFGFRLFQADWLPARSAGQWSKDRARLGAGVVISLSRR